MTNTVAATLALIALVVGPARAVQPQRMIMHEGLLLGKLSALPPWLSALGVSLVGHEKAQHMVRSMSKVTAISTLGVTVNVTALAKDDTIGRLQKEFANRRDAWGRDCGECDDYGLRHLTSPMPLILDVGGNIGFISSLIARVHPQSQVIAFEPSPVTYFILRINFWLNGVHVLTTEELQGRPKIGGVYPVFGGLGASRAPFEWLEVAGNALAQSQNVNISFGKSGESDAKGAFMPRCWFSVDQQTGILLDGNHVLNVLFNGAFWSRLLTALDAANLFATSMEKIGVLHQRLPDLPIIITAGVEPIIITAGWNPSYCE
ncbi:hypothetical protein EMIHUDRAFT_241774 [Emiliania huxleyi CCMP1516]|uniref:Methyltransferase FkbM domain-containing protein n=2 Tax=Emiliania huxleyi TaxID=2903 RepID=A0A0D3JBE6_EMIH1|nr:hypothetical protein EMIHUDRAFT_241774 [Emiliania huxleyi CCMP1516]EOD20831.1 hypothetical protein EMIHUDRAFT_241774 [Emiliania huxleyi CCMP1516]|eukprot:XP_005773260.1 hypothetical protein EMIHUDRAFT_241774 [Emiliania huxleyi CCMP1516]